MKHITYIIFADSEEDGEIELATAVLAPISECVQKKYQETLLFLIATDVSIHFMLMWTEASEFFFFFFFVSLY